MAMLRSNIDNLRDKVGLLHHSMLETARRWDDIIQGRHPEQQLSAANLFHYLAMRREDLRNVQDELHNAGLSSLASSESHALGQVQAVLERLGVDIPEEQRMPVDYPTASRLIQQRAARLFGPKINPNIPHLMVTFDTNLAHDYAVVKALALAGMNVARINCAHDDVGVWTQMAENVRKASRATGLSCKIYLDLAGPKIRTRLLGKGSKKGFLELREGSTILLAEEGMTFERGERVVGCTLEGVVYDLQPGDRVLFDDGLIEGVVQERNEGVATVRLSRVSTPKMRLKAGKGINFPDTLLSVSSLTEADLAVIPFAREYADVVGFSFVRQPKDVATLQDLLRQDSDRYIPLVLKIETYDAAQNLPALLLQGMKEPAFGVMIARGDLAVEIGFERLSEIQEEILWLCEAAHAPVIWATQVLESLNKSGIATRSELTDAAYAAHAECVMLNKGKHLLKVLSTLRNILHRSGGHHLKKRYIFRPLGIAEQFLRKVAPEPAPPIKNSRKKSQQDQH
jgi:pyruvate kinase